MSEQQLFLREKEYYQRDIQPINHYLEQAAMYISKMSGDPIEQCKEFVRHVITSKQSGIKNPVVKFFHRGDNGDRLVDHISLSRYIDTLVKRDLILAPTFTCYKNPTQIPSKLVGFVEGNKKRRSQAKKEGFKAKAAGNNDLFIMKDNEQKNMKNYNNSMSGAFGSKGSVFYNPTAHSSLTSTIRSVSSFGNASNERVVMGNRHYYNEDIVLYNLNCYCTEIDRDEIKQAIEHYKLHIPTVQDVMDCIEYSTRFYFQNPLAMERIQAYVEKMDDIERAAFCYIGDLYRIRVLNNDFMLEFINRLSKKCTGHVENALDKIWSIDEQILNYAHQIGYNDLRGKGKDYAKMPYETVCMLVLTSENIAQVLKDYDLFIKAFFLTKMVPASHAFIRSMMRRSVVLSDTDSTCFSTDDWMLWYFGKINFSEETFAVCGAVAFIATQAVSHLLAILSANINVPREMLHDLAMKNEFLWTVHMPTNVAKHYAAWTVVQEGNVFANPSLEIKGVHLKNSAAPPDLIKGAHAMITEILTTVSQNQPLELLKYIKRVQDIERSVMESLRSGESKYLKQSKIKDASAYSLPEDESPYQHYKLWLEVYQHAYGPINPPPFGTLIIPTKLRNRTVLKEWVDSLPNIKMREAMTEWLVRKKKNDLNTIYLPSEYVQSHGVPQEIRSIMDIEKIAIDLTLVYRIILESLGFFVKSGSLVSSYH
jgi:hypothetical protein